MKQTNRSRPHEGDKARGCLCGSVLQRHGFCLFRVGAVNSVAGGDVKQACAGERPCAGPAAWASRHGRVCASRMADQGPRVGESWTCDLGLSWSWPGSNVACGACRSLGLYLGQGLGPNVWALGLTKQKQKDQ